VIDELDFKYVVFSSVTETYDNGLLSYRHLWARGSWGDDSHPFTLPDDCRTADEWHHLVIVYDTMFGYKIYHNTAVQNNPTFSH
jgi:hypothetical protein